MTLLPYHVGQARSPSGVERLLGLVLRAKLGADSLLLVTAGLPGGISEAVHLGSLVEGEVTCTVARACLVQLAVVINPLCAVEGMDPGVHLFGHAPICTGRTAWLALACVLGGPPVSYPLLTVGVRGGLALGRLLSWRLLLLGATWTVGSSRSLGKVHHTLAQALGLAVGKGAGVVAELPAGRGLAERLRGLQACPERSDDARLDQVWEDHRAATDAPLVHPVVLPLGRQDSPAVEHALASGAHAGGQDRTPAVVAADRVGVELGRQRAGAQNLQGLVATGVTDELREAHGFAAFRLRLPGRVSK